jgi:acyl-CoA synthetase (AMP-forming)/AMP-acid ligase II
MIVPFCMARKECELTIPKAGRYSQSSMLRRFLSLAAAAPAHPALVDGQSGLVITRGDLLARAGELGAEWTAAGLRLGDVVAVQLSNSSELVAALLAALQLGLVMALIDRDASETEVATILSHFAIKGLLYRPDRASSRAAISIRSVISPPALAPNARLIKLTSGSTGMPKAIVCTEENLIADCENICATMGITPSDVNLGAIPFSHSYGFSNLVTPLLLQGTAVVMSNDYLPLSLLALANRYHCTVAPLIPMVFDHLTNLPKSDGDFRSVRTFISAGAPLMPATSRRFRERFGVDVHTFYGCSECGGIAYDRSGGAVERGTVGSPLEGVRTEVDGRSQRMAVRSDSVALGYLHDATTFHPFEQRRFVTDDFVSIDAASEISISGRSGDLINTAGKKVNPREVEQVILQIDGVRQAKVYGEPAGARGEVVAAAVVASPDVTRDQVRQFCRARLSLHKVPRIVKLIESIPVDERGKVKRAALALL